MGVWAYRCMGVWAYGCIFGCMDVLVYGYMGALIPKCKRRLDRAGVSEVQDFELRE